jgi:hypothetical protein
MTKKWWDLVRTKLRSKMIVRIVVIVKQRFVPKINNSILHDKGKKWEFLSRSLMRGYREGNNYIRDETLSSRVIQGVSKWLGTNFRANPLRKMRLKTQTKLFAKTSSFLKKRKCSSLLENFSNYVVHLSG